MLNKVIKLNNDDSFNIGYDALNDKFVNMIENGIIDPTKVTLTALTNACSVAGIMLTTACLITDEAELENPNKLANAHGIY